MGFPRIVPHQDGAGVIDKVGPGVPETRLGERVWLYEAQFGRAFGTAAQFTVIPAAKAVPLPDDISFETGACLARDAKKWIPVFRKNPALIPRNRSRL